MLKAIASVLIVLGLAFGASGVVAADFIADEARVENVQTGDDASIPEAQVLGPFTMISQADNIEKHTLARTEGQRYSEMARDDEARPMWITATTLRTALHFGALAYAFALFVVVVGLALVLQGAALLVIDRRMCCKA